MPVQRELWSETLRKDYTPNWHCPSCDGGYLRLKPDSLQLAETRKSREAHEHDDWTPEWTSYRFVAILVCNNERCQEPISISGRGGVEFVCTAEWEAHYVEFLYPEHVAPSPMIITLPEDCPPEVRKELQRSFVTFWGDPSASANHIRSAVELLMDSLREPRSRLNKNGKKYRLSLHRRIESLSKRDKGLADSLLAVKWLGNEGSHSDKLTRDDIFDALDIVEAVLEDLYVRHRKRVMRLVSVINKREGPRPKGGQRSKKQDTL